MKAYDSSVDLGVSGWEDEGGAMPREISEVVQPPRAFASAEVGISAPPVHEIGTASGGLAQAMDLRSERPPHDGMDADGAPIY